MISLIVAHDMNRAIGKSNTLPWSIKEDLRYFSKITRGKTVVMGEKTYESIGKLLPNRTNIILTKDKDYKVEGAVIINDPMEIIELSRTSDVFIIGGGQVYKLFLPYAENLYITKIDLYLEEADTYFPQYEDEFECLIEGVENYSVEQDCLFSFTLWKRKK